MPRRRNNKRNNSKKNDESIRIDKDHPPPLDLLHYWLVEGDMQPLSLMVELNWGHLVNEPFKWHPDKPPEIMFLMLCCRDDLPRCSIDWMIENGADLRAKDENGVNAMQWAFIGNAFEVIKALAGSREKHWLMHEPNDYGDTAFKLIKKVAERCTSEEEAEEAEEAPITEAVPIAEDDPIAESLPNAEAVLIVEAEAV